MRLETSRTPGSEVENIWNVFIIYIVYLSSLFFTVPLCIWRGLQKHVLNNVQSALSCHCPRGEALVDAQLSGASLQNALKDGRCIYQEHVAMDLGQICKHIVYEDLTNV